MTRQADRLPKEGDTLKNGAVVLRADLGVQTSEIFVLCVWKQSPHHPFVHWRLDPKTGDCHGGSYQDNLEDANESFESRLIGN